MPTDEMCVCGHPKYEHHFDPKSGKWGACGPCKIGVAAPCLGFKKRERRGLTRIREFTAAELSQALAIALREDNKSEAAFIFREYRRRKVRIPQKQYWDARRKWGLT